MFEVAKLEFNKWLENTDISSLSSYEKTMIGIIIDYFDDIANCGRANGARANKISKYIAALEYKAERECFPTFDNKIINNNVKRLISLTVSNFRGFGSVEEFDFSTQYTFYHGPNGSGKTSFCEAIEYSVLGSVAEASSRGISLKKYLSHAGNKKYTEPTLMCELLNGQIEKFSPSLSDYRFAFIEKNRILDFSHIGAASAKYQTERIAALFGITEFETFVHEFTDHFDKRYISLESDIFQKFESKKFKLQNKNEEKSNLLNTIESKKGELKELIESLGQADIITSEQAKDYLTNSKTGLIPLATKHSLENHIELMSEEDLQTLSAHVETFLIEIEIIKTNNKLILSNLGDVNLSQLFDAVISIEDTFSEKVCPVCRTPLTDTIYNPFNYARKELKKFQSIENAKKNIKSSSKKIAESIQAIIDELSNKSIALLFSEFDIETVLTATVQASEYEIIDIETIGPVLVCIKKINSKMKQDTFYSDIATHNINAKNTNKEYDDKVDKLQKISEEITAIDSTIAVLENQYKSLAEEISLMDSEIEKLEKATKDINDQISFNKKMIEAYESIRKRLANYVDRLPAILAANLSEKVQEYYNFINRGDAKFELIKKIKLPVTANEKIMVQMDDGLDQDALQILSEGHVRILGLSILLAKATSEKMPFIVFDDIVNSIDDDHRDGVASLLITHPDFKDIQMILTCHGEMFVNSLESYVEEQKKMTRFMFLSADNLEGRGVAIKYQDSTIPLRIAHKKCNNGELKDSAAKCRQAVECISGTLWKKISPCKGGISVKLRKLEGRPDLKSVVDALKSATKPNRMDGVEKLHELLGRLTNQKTWNILNKGTHIDDTLPEFSRTEIKELLKLLELLDNEVKLLKIKPSAV